VTSLTSFMGILLPENVSAVQRKIEEKADENRDDNYRDIIMNFENLGHGPNAEGVQEKASSRDHGVSERLVMDFTMSGLEAPVTVDQEVRDGADQSSACDGEDVPDMENFCHRKEKGVVHPGRHDGGDLGLAKRC